MNNFLYQNKVVRDQIVSSIHKLANIDIDEVSNNIFISNNIFMIFIALRFVFLLWIFDV